MNPVVETSKDDRMLVQNEQFRLAEIFASYPDQHEQLSTIVSDLLMSESANDPRFQSLAIDLMRKDQYLTCLSMAKELVERNSDHALFFRKVCGMCLQGLGDHNNAISCLSEYLELGGDMEDTIPLIGNSLLLTGQFDEAEQVYAVLMNFGDRVGESLFFQGRVKEAKMEIELAAACYERALATDLGDLRSEAYSCLGAMYYRLRLYEQARSNFQQAVDINESAITLSQLINATRCCGDLDLAEEQAMQSLALAQTPEGWCAYLDALVAARKLSEASEAYTSALEFFPDHDRILRAGGPLMMHLARWPDAVEANFAAAHMIFQNMIEPMISLPAQRQMIPSMPGPRAEQALADFKQILDQSPYTFFLGFGTLLGCIRDNDFISHDKDVDVGMWWDVDRDDLTQLLTQSDLFAEIYGVEFADSVLDKNMWIRSFRHKPTGIAIDVSFFKQETNITYSGFCDEPYEFLYEFSPFKLRYADFKGEQFLIPDQTEAHLCELYGTDWAIPDPTFDTVVSAFNLSEESSVVRAAYGYGRLADAMISGDWRKASAYVKTLDELETDPERRSQLLKMALFFASH